MNLAGHQLPVLSVIVDVWHTNYKQVYTEIEFASGN